MVEEGESLPPCVFVGIPESVGYKFKICFGAFDEVSFFNVFF